MKKLKVITENLHILGPYLILLGVMRLYAYYSVFKINIINYLDFSEFIISFLNCGFILFCFLVLYMLALLFFRQMGWISHSRNGFTNVDATRDGRMVWTIFGLSFLVCFAPIIRMIKFSAVYSATDYWKGQVGSALLFMVPVFILCLYYKKIKIGLNLFLILSFFSFSIIFDYTLNKALAYETICSAPVTIILMKENKAGACEPVVQSDSTNVFVGRTKNYAFLCNWRNNKNSIANKDNTAVTAYSLEGISSIKLIEGPKMSIVFNSYW